MTLVALVSAKGAPGVSLTALALAAAWPADDRGKVLLEADPAGGTLAVRYQLGRQPGLVTLAASGRHGLSRADLWSHVQPLPGGLGAIVAPERGDRASAVLQDTGRHLGGWLASLDDVFTVADCGRVAPSEAMAGVASQADRVFVVARPRAEEIYPAAVLADIFNGSGVGAEWVLIGDRPHGPDEIQEATGVRVGRVLPDDPRGADAIVTGQADGRRSRLARAISAWAADLAAQLQPSPPEPLTEEPLRDGEPVEAMP